MNQNRLIAEDRLFDKLADQLYHFGQQLVILTQALEDLNRRVKMLEPPEERAIMLTPAPARGEER